MLVKSWKTGDRVVHAGKPEWGVGEVTSAVGELHEGRAGQRLVIRFQRAGVKTLSTAFADLRPADELPLIERQTQDLAALGAPADAVTVEVLAKLPDDATDPFRSLKGRLSTSLALYRFTHTGGSLLDWAASQTGLKDPLTRFSRHELERFFDRFRANLDQHVRKLILDMKKQDPAGLAETLAAARPEAKQALRRIDVGR